MIKTYQNEEYYIKITASLTTSLTASMQEVNSSITKSLTAITDIERKSEY